mmetsp:Transcript_41469/g.47879  ORF Transcript_41469/g.47879 Transcript_41469/m.47879 type:complete len:92 (-) Transcript_41469:165-440(-)
MMKLFFFGIVDYSCIRSMYDWIVLMYMPEKNDNTALDRASYYTNRSDTLVGMGVITCVVLSCLAIGSCWYPLLFLLGKYVQKSLFSKPNIL